MDHSKKSTYLFSIDALRVIAILAVILVHVSTKTLDVGHFDLIKDPLALFLNQVSRFAVPLFFLISGFVLELNNKDGLSYSTFFKKRASRILVPYIFWSTFYYYIGWGFDISKLFNTHFLTDLLTGKASYHLYFIPTLILFYLAFPFLHSKIDFLKKTPTLLIITVIQFALVAYDYYVKQLPVHYDLRVALLSVSMFVYGMVASHNKERIYQFVKKNAQIFVALTFFLSALIFVHVRAISLGRHTSSYIYNQYSPLNYLYTLVFTSSLFYLLEKTQFLRKQFITLSKLSFFVFFIHVFVLDLVWKNFFYKLLETNGSSLITQIWFTPLFFAVVTLLSFGIAYGIHKISFAPKITG